MRQIKKAQPPANVAPSGQAPRTLKQSELALRVGLETATDRADHARKSHFDALNKHKVRKALLVEQGSICVYCERRLEIPEDDMGDPIENGLPIEHWRPLSRDPGLALTWKNIYLSCCEADTCDGAKGDQRLVSDEEDEDLPWPADAPYETWLGISKGGELYVRSDAAISPERRRALCLAIGNQMANGRMRAAILNLNAPKLVSARKAEIDKEIRLASRERRTLSGEERRTRAQALLSKSPLPSFVSARVAWWTRELGKSR